MITDSLNSNVPIHFFISLITFHCTKLFFNFLANQIYQAGLNKPQHIENSNHIDAFNFVCKHQIKKHGIKIFAQFLNHKLKEFRIATDTTVGFFDVRPS